MEITFCKFRRVIGDFSDRSGVQMMTGAIIPLNDTSKN